MLRCRAVECQQLYNRISDLAASQFLGCWVSVYNFTAASCCFIIESLASRHVRRVYEFNSRGVTDDSETAVTVTVSFSTGHVGGIRLRIDHAILMHHVQVGAHLTDVVLDLISNLFGRTQRIT